jgi:predicted nucleotidyltransferase
MLHLSFLCYYFYMTLHDVIEKIAPDIKSVPKIHAMWLEGSWATGRNNDQSDIDVWLDVENGAFTECIDRFRDALMKAGNIDWEKSRGVYSTEPKLEKHTFHLSGFSEPQRIELDLQEHSRSFIFDKNEHVIEVIFDKDNTIQWRDT